MSAPAIPIDPSPRRAQWALLVVSFVLGYAVLVTVVSTLLPIEFRLVAAVPLIALGWRCVFWLKDHEPDETVAHHYDAHSITDQPAGDGPEWPSRGGLPGYPPPIGMRHDRDPRVVDPLAATEEGQSHADAHERLAGEAGGRTGKRHPAREEADIPVLGDHAEQIVGHPSPPSFSSGA